MSSYVYSRLYVFRNAYNNSGEEDHHTRLMQKNGESIAWDQIKQLANQTTHSWRIYRLPQEAVELTNFSKMRVCLMEKVSSLPYHHFVSKN